jgi:beta-carotene 3-hydroxylase
MNWLFPIAGIAAFLGMEAVAWLTHKYVMHGLLWFFHKDHHQVEEGFFQKNDFFFVIFAIPSWLCIMLGLMYKHYTPVWIGGGIAAYGLCYFLVHDVFIHQRFSWLKKSNSIYFKALRKGHKVHHKHLNKEDGECFGMLWVPRKYFREVRKTK